MDHGGRVQRLRRLSRKLGLPQPLHIRQKPLAQISQPSPAPSPPSPASAPGSPSVPPSAASCPGPTATAKTPSPVSVSSLFLYQSQTTRTTGQDTSIEEVSVRPVTGYTDMSGAVPDTCPVIRSKRHGPHTLLCALCRRRQSGQVRTRYADLLDARNALSLEHHHPGPNAPATGWSLLSDRAPRYPVGRPVIGSGQATHNGRYQTQTSGECEQNQSLIAPYVGASEAKAWGESVFTVTSLSRIPICTMTFGVF